MDMVRHTRREFVISLGIGVGTAGLAGCLGGESATGLSLETVAVAGSPEEEVVVNPEGEAALLDFFATWCAPCKPQMGHLRTVDQELPGLHLLSVTRETDTDAVTAFWRQFEGTWPVAQDPKLDAFKAFGVKGIPTLVLIDSDGDEAWRHTGLAAAETILAEIETAGGPTMEDG